MIAGVVAVLDAGLTATLSREFARVDISQKIKSDTLSTLETVYLIILTSVVFILCASSDLIASNWLKSTAFAEKELSLFIKLISFDVGFQMLFRFYLGGILGLEKQVLANILQVGWGMLRNGLVVLVIYFNPTLTTFFTWQMGSTILLAIVTKFFLIKKLIGKSQLKFSVKIKKSTISRVWKFAGGMMLISLVGALNSQMDKIAISKLLALETLGYYTLAVSLSTALVTVVTPISVALLPRFTALYSGGEVETGKNIFKLVNILTTVLIFTLMVNMMIYSTELIWIWTGEIDLGIEGGKYLPYLL